MKRWIIALITLLLVAPLFIAAQDDDATDPEPRTYYESLALDTPETAIETFMAAFQRQDYWTVYLILSPKTQFTIRQNINLLRYDSLILVDDYDDYATVIADQSIGSGLEDWEHIDTGYYFDEMMLAGTEHDRLLIDLRGEFTIGDVVDQLSDDGVPFVEVMVAVATINEPVVFRLIQSASQRWRVESVILSGGDPEETSPPWIVPQAEDE